MISSSHTCSLLAFPFFFRKLKGTIFAFLFLPLFCSDSSADYFDGHHVRSCDVRLNIKYHRYVIIITDIHNKILYGFMFVWYLSQVTYVIPTYSAVSRLNFPECRRRLLQIGCAPSAYYRTSLANSLNDGITQLPNTPSNGAGVVSSAKRKLRRLERSSGRFHRYMYT